MAWVRTTRLFGALALVATLVPLAVVPTVAGAAGSGGGSIVHTRGSDVWLTSPDGGQAARVTSDGSSASPDGKGSEPYTWPSQSDNGEIIVAVRNQLESNQLSLRGYLWVMNRRGEVLAKVAPPQFEFLPHPSCSGMFLQNPRGITNASVSPDGTKIAYQPYTHFKNGCFELNDLTEVHVVNVDGSGHRVIRRASNNTVGRLRDPSWVNSSRLLVNSQSIDQLGVNYVDLPDTVARQWFDADATRYAALETDKLATTTPSFLTSTLDLWTANGGPPAPPAARCQLTGAAGRFYTPSWAAGAAALAWEEWSEDDEPGEGIWVSPVGDLGTTCPTRADARLIVPHGGYPSWGPAPVTVAVAGTSTSLMREGDALVATVSGPPPPISGQVRFEVNGAAGPLVTVGAGGRASMPVSGLSPGTYTVVARYLGSVTHLPSSSVALTVVVPAPDSRFTALPPVRILDTRTGNGVPAAGAVAAKRVVELQVSGRGGVPANATAVVLNVTAVGMSGSPSSYLTAWPTGEVRPNASNLNYVAGEVIPNLVTVKVGTGGRVSLYNDSGSVHVLADVAGYYATGADSAFNALQPERLLDTRTGNGAPRATVGPNGVVELQVTGRGGVPSGATGVVLNVTAVGLAGAPVSYVTAWPTGSPLPNASNLNLVTGQVIPNLVVAKIGAGGKVSLRNDAGNVHLLADVAGYYGPTGATFSPVAPSRLLDTRTGVGAPAVRVPAGGTVELQVTGRGGVAAGATGVVLNVTAVGLAGSPSSWLTAWPTGQPMPLASNLNMVTGQTVPNSVIAKIGANGKVSISNAFGNLDILADLAGYYTS